MSNQAPFISICIPSYNRSAELLRLLRSVDCSKHRSELEIVICEDHSPRREEVRRAVNEFKQETPFDVVYRENGTNLGYDKNLRELVRIARGVWIVFMGDDDVFVPGALDKFFDFLAEHKNLGYVLKSHELVHGNGKVEKFRYYPGTTFFDSGVDSYVALFRKSVLISGFAIRRDLSTPFLIDEFDGTLLFQMYLLAEIVLKYPAAYFDEPLTRQYEGGIPLFGNAQSEKHLYTPGTITVQNSLNFLKGFFKITAYIDKKYNLASTNRIRKDMSKYFYPSLAIQREKGMATFLGYVRELNKIGFGITGYYYAYVLFLLVFGRRMCDNGIRILKNVLGKTPQL